MLLKSSTIGVALVVFLLPVACGSNCRHYSFALGDINATVLSDGYVVSSVNTILLNVEQEVWESALSENFLVGNVTFYYNPLHLDFGDRKVMVDVGSGDKFGPDLGQVLLNMDAAGLDPREVTDVLITHAHVDHIAGLLLPGGGGLAFPNAKVHLSRVEHDFWMSATAAVYPPETTEPELAQLVVSVAKSTLEAIRDQLVLFELGSEVIPGVTSRGAGGHTPGQVNYVIRSGNQTLLHAADVLVWDVFSIQHPDWEVTFDLDFAKGVDARYALLEELAQTGVMFYSYHNGFPGLGHIKRQGQGYGLHPVKYHF